MTPSQISRWRDFSTRMARTYPGITDRRRARLLGEVRSFFDACCDELPFVIDWDSGVDDPALGSYRFHGGGGDLVSDHFWRDQRWSHLYWNEERNEPTLFRDQIGCCLRAGCDVAGEPSAGVLGFNKGDLERMYADAGGVPDWFVETVEGGRAVWDEAPGDAGVWL